MGCGHILVFGGDRYGHPFVVANEVYFAFFVDLMAAFGGATGAMRVFESSSVAVLRHFSFD